MLLVCEKCVERDPGLQEFITAKGQYSNNCSYCNTKSSNKKIDLKLLTNHILDCLKESYQIKESKPDKYETLSSFLEKYFPVPEKKLIENTKSLIKEEIGEVYLIEKMLINTWDDFSDYTKKETRFFFSPRAEILKEAMKIIKNNNLIQRIKPLDKKKIYRARAFKEGNRIVYDLRRMGPPEPEDTINISNRMSPPGVPVFYASFEKTTALSEISQKGREGCAYISEFHFLREIKVIDLTLSIEESLPSFFDIDKTRREKRSDLIFIQGLSAKLSEPIDKDGREHTDYVPTQILAEYIKKQDIHGIIYESRRIKNSKGKNIALFFSQKNIFTDEQNSINQNIYLKFIKDDKTYNLPFRLDE